MGEFAKKKIRSAVTFLNNASKEQNTREQNWDEGWTKESVAEFIEFIGEPLLRKSMNELYLKAFILPEEAEIDAQIKRLQEYKKSNIKNNEQV